MGKPESKKARGPKPPVSKYAQKGSLEKECVKPEVPVVLTDHVFDVVGRTGFLNNTKGYTFLFDSNGARYYVAAAVLQRTVALEGIYKHRRLKCQAKKSKGGYEIVHILQVLQ